MLPDIYPKETPKAVIFDWDNTLVNSWKTIWDSINLAKEHLGLPLMSEEEFWSTPHRSLKDSAQDLFGKHWQEGIDIYYNAVRERHLESLETLVGSFELIKFLSENDIYMAVVSNKRGDILRREAKHLGWDHHFGSIIGSHDTAEDKPSPIPVIEALKPAGLKSGNHVWFIGDSVVDLECAKNSNCVPVIVGDTFDGNHDHPTGRVGGCHDIMLYLKDFF